MQYYNRDAKMDHNFDNHPCGLYRGKFVDLLDARPWTQHHLILRVHVPNIWVLGIWVIVIIVQLWVK